MLTIQIIALLAFAWCIVFCLIHFFRLVKLGKVKDLSQKNGNVTKAVIYSNTIAMSPTQKESAYKHLPTYTAGIIFHLGSFLSLLLFILSFLDKIWTWILMSFYGRVFFYIIVCFLLISFSCGLFLFLKRLFSKKLRPFSNLDDYFSNGIVVLFQLFSFALFAAFTIPSGTLGILLIADFSFFTFFLILHALLIYGYYITAIILFLYLPFGKLKHVIYYFAARYHLGFFYGWRNAWPPKKV